MDIAPTPASSLEDIKDCTLSRAVRIPHAGCQVSSWNPVNVRQIWVSQKRPTFWFTSHRPLGVRKRTSGGRKGYSVGNKILPWYRPSSNTVSLGPRRVKCHSNRLSCIRHDTHFCWHRSIFWTRITLELLDFGHDPLHGGRIFLAHHDTGGCRRQRHDTSSTPRHWVRGKKNPFT